MFATLTARMPASSACVKGGGGDLGRPTSALKPPAPPRAAAPREDDAVRRGADLVEGDRHDSMRSKSKRSMASLGVAKLCRQESTDMNQQTLTPLAAQRSDGT